MTRGAGDRAVGRQQRIKKQVASEVYLLRRKAIAVRGQRGLRTTEAHALYGIVLLVQRAQYTAVFRCQFKTGGTGAGELELRCGIRNRSDGCQRDARDIA